MVSFDRHREAFELAVRHRNREMAEFHLRRMREWNEDFERFLVPTIAARGIAEIEQWLRDVPPQR
jgi:hypothetical protein